ncbi:hypothetical protein GA0115252_13475 [Streptomyces sp. DfronAA-171]|nr:hypothetical protein GA0115252_13475 [Streptomyces sp. DfronAA-171]
MGGPGERRAPERRGLPGVPRRASARPVRGEARRTATQARCRRVRAPPTPPAQGPGVKAPPTPPAQKPRARTSHRAPTTAVRSPSTPPGNHRHARRPGREPPRHQGRGSGPEPFSPGAAQREAAPGSPPREALSGEQPRARGRLRRAAPRASPGTTALRRLSVPARALESLPRGRRREAAPPHSLARNRPARLRGRTTRPAVSQEHPAKAPRSDSPAQGPVRSRFQEPRPGLLPPPREPPLTSHPHLPHLTPHPPLLTHATTPRASRTLPPPRPVPRGCPVR